MNFSQMLLVALSAWCFLGIGSAEAQTLFTLSVVSKGTFKFDQAYPIGPFGKLPFNFHGVRPPNPRKGETINYFVFKPSEDVIASMKSMSKDRLFSTIEPCSWGIDKTLSERAQMIGGELRSILGRTDLLPYLKRKGLIESDGYIYVPIDANLRNYVRSGTEYGYEWVQEAGRKKQLCLHIGVGRMGYGAFASQPINVSRLANFVFFD
ncbi:hypothetical protein [Mesorhizobium hawassense]|nr:hypothetical protein [Mesorhizobium hawassense]